MARTAELSLTRQLGYQLVIREIGAKALDRASYFLLDGLASVLAGSATVPGAKLVEWLRAEAPSPERSAFAMAGAAHVLELDDLHRASVTHPGCVVIPAALATVRRRQLGSVALLTAIVRGYEAMIRVGESVGRSHYRMFHNTATCGPFGAAAAVVSLRGLGEDGYTTAFGNAGTLAGGLWQFNVEGTMSKHLHAAHAARSGLVAAELAGFGFTGPERILEGEHGFHATMCPDASAKAVLAPTRDWKILETSVKPWPSCRHTHPAIDAALRLAAHVEAGRIESVKVATYPAALEVCDRPVPINAYQAGFSLQHCVATALALGDVGLEQLGERSLESEAVRSLSERITVEVGQGYADSYPRRWQASVSLRLDDGTSMSEEALAARGDPEAALSWDELVEKAAGMFARIGWKADRVARLAEAIERMPRSRDARPLESVWEALDEQFLGVSPAPPAASSRPERAFVGEPRTATIAPVAAAAVAPRGEARAERPVAAPAAPAPQPIALGAPPADDMDPGQDEDDVPLVEVSATLQEDETAAAAAPAGAQEVDQARALFERAGAAHESRQFQEAERCYRQAIDAFYRLGRTDEDADATQQLARLKHQMGEHEVSHQLYTRALALYRGLGDRRAEAELLRFIGILARDEGDLDEAEEAFGAATRIFNEVKDPEQQAATLYLASLVAKERGNKVVADKLLGDAKRIYGGAAA